MTRAHVWIKVDNGNHVTYDNSAIGVHNKTPNHLNLLSFICFPLPLSREWDGKKYSEAFCGKIIIIVTLYFHSILPKHNAATYSGVLGLWRCERCGHLCSPNIRPVCQACTTIPSPPPCSYFRHVITPTPYMVLPLFATWFAAFVGGIRVSFMQPRLF